MIGIPSLLGVNSFHLRLFFQEKLEVPGAECLPKVIGERGHKSVGSNNAAAVADQRDSCTTSVHFYEKENLVGSQYQTISDFLLLNENCAPGKPVSRARHHGLQVAQVRLLPFVNFLSISLAIGAD
jgi:hypothetical protein